MSIVVRTIITIPKTETIVDTVRIGPFVCGVVCLFCCVSIVVDLRSFTAAHLSFAHSPSHPPRPRAPTEKPCTRRCLSLSAKSPEVKRLPFEYVFLFLFPVCRFKFHLNMTSSPIPLFPFSPSQSYSDFKKFQKAWADLYPGLLAQFSLPGFILRETPEALLKRRLGKCFFFCCCCCCCLFQGALHFRSLVSVRSPHYPFNISLPFNTC